ncbi:MAG: DUF305 domain-containing protein [Balneolaceae bacterium]
MNRFMIFESKTRSIIKITAIFLASLGVTACSGTETVVTEPASSSVDKSSLEALYWSRIDSSRMSFTDADVFFMTGMIGHHAQALIMSRLAPENGASKEIQVLASRIINAQKDEIASMQQWLKDREQPVPEVHIDGLNLMIHGAGGHGSHADHTDMPGMLSQEQLVELSETTGSNFDKLFLEYMINHHNGAVIMVKELFATDGAAQDEEAFRLAADIQVDQITEIERMKLMLSQLANS